MDCPKCGAPCRLVERNDATATSPEQHRFRCDNGHTFVVEIHETE